jgi:PAS domain-containing protein
MQKRERPTPGIDPVQAPGASASAFANGLSTEQASCIADLMVKAPAFVCTLAGPEHVFDFANDQYRKLAGHRELLGNTVREVFPEVASQGFFELLDRVYRTGEPFVGQEIPIRLYGENGESEVRRLNFVYEAIRDNRGGARGIFVHGIDVTEHVDARNRLQQSEERLARQNRELAGLAADLERQQRLFDTALSSIVDFAYVVDLDGRFLYVKHPCPVSASAWRW